MLMDQDKKLMGYVIDWKNEIGAIAGPFSPNDTKESWLDRAARKAHVSLRHIKSIYYGHVTDPKHSVASNILTAAEQARVAAAKLDALTLASRFETIAGGLNAQDSDFHCEDVAALINAARLLRGLDSAGNKGEVK